VAGKHGEELERHRAAVSDANGDPARLAIVHLRVEQMQLLRGGGLEDWHRHAGLALLRSRLGTRPASRLDEEGSAGLAIGSSEHAVGVVLALLAIGRDDESASHAIVARRVVATAGRLGARTTPR